MQLQAKFLVVLCLGTTFGPSSALAQNQYGGQDNPPPQGYQQPQGYPAQQQGYPTTQQPYPNQSGYPPQGYNNYPPQQYPPAPYNTQQMPFGNQPSYRGQSGPGLSSPAGYNNDVSAAGPMKATPQQQAKVFQWFQKYDDVRRRAQMNPVEKQQADSILGKGLSILMPGPEKLAAKDILARLVTRYDNATKALEALPPTNETKRLQQGYYQYFSNARALFADYLRVQDNLMAKDANGQPIMAQLMQRKQGLEQLERACKEADAQSRAAFGVPAYQY
ncbi:MAG: hypothetical protein K2W95_05170 [Candidatus Obscuribacterales bacterium]|nr:hypothetical protein [Candidatus Obscuribacterales bacterium]